RPSLDMMRRNVRLEARLIDDLLDMTRIRQGKLNIEPEVVDLHEVLADVVDLCQEAVQTGSLDARLDARAVEHHVRGDPTRLRQVLWSRERNAIHATPPGGRISIRTANDDDQRVTVTVSDTGIGIAPARLARLFEPFEQVVEASPKSPGLGLGLSIAKALVEA